MNYPICEVPADGALRVPELVPSNSYRSPSDALYHVELISGVSVSGRLKDGSMAFTKK
jgi:hypothetical protein